jgi:hypothetical protein
MESISRNLFKQTSIDIVALYKQSLRASEVAYNQGKEDALEEVLKYVMHYQGQQLKYVPMNDFINYLQRRYDCHKFKSKPYLQAT